MTVQHWEELVAKFCRSTGLSAEFSNTTKRRGRHSNKPLLREVEVLILGAILKKFETGEICRPFVKSSDLQLRIAKHVIRMQELRF
jgi:hypothetical protein